MDNYGNKLQRVLKATGWSQEALASRLGISFATLNSWVNGKSEPRDSAKQRIDTICIEILGTDVVAQEQFSMAKRRASSARYTVTKLIRNRPLLEKLTTSLTYHSNGTEGSTMTEQDVMAVIYDDKILRNRTAIEQREAINHQSALYYLLDELAKPDFQFSSDVIKATHLRMMNGIVSDAGYYRNHAVRISGSRTPVANYNKISELTENWCNVVNGKTTDRIKLLASSHADFERIHPFTDGNGRTGRLLLFALALKLNLIPPILKKERRFAYYKYLELAQTRDNTEPLELFIAESILDTAKIIEAN